MEQFHISGFWRRFIALIYDVIIVASIIFVGTFIAIMLVSAIWGKQAMEEGLLYENNLFRVYLFSLWFGYYAVSWMRGGQTLGMKPWRMYVLDNKKNYIDFKQSLLRFSSGFLGLGLFLIPFHKEKKALQDIVSSSQTLVKNKS